MQLKKFHVKLYYSIFYRQRLESLLVFLKSLVLDNHDKKNLNRTSQKTGTRLAFLVLWDLMGKYTASKKKQKSFCIHKPSRKIFHSNFIANDYNLQWHIWRVSELLIFLAGWNSFENFEQVNMWNSCYNLKVWTSDLVSKV